MKTLYPLVICLVLSLTVAGQAVAWQLTLPVEGINKVLQMKIDQDVVNSFNHTAFFPQNADFSTNLEADAYPDVQRKIYTVPDCLCHVYARIH